VRKNTENNELNLQSYCSKFVSDLARYCQQTSVKNRFRVIQENDHPVAIGCLGKFQDIMDGLFVAALLVIFLPVACCLFPPFKQPNDFSSRP
jgi:hypothetical protein